MRESPNVCAESSPHALYKQWQSALTTNQILILHLHLSFSFTFFFFFPFLFSMFRPFDSSTRFRACYPKIAIQTTSSAVSKREKKNHKKGMKQTKN